MRAHVWWIAATWVVVLGCSDDATEEPDATAGTDAGGEIDSAASGATTYRGEVYVDNWSAMYVGDTLVMEDSVPITTERSFNAEVFTFEATRPFQVNVVMKDYIENDSGLEYIGQPNQQMGDGGYIAQLIDTSTGEVVLVSNSEWRCLTIHEAPLNTECEDDPDPVSTCTAAISEEPEGWREADFDDSGWTTATEYTEAEVSPRLGYEEIGWDSSASLIWGADLQTHNTILCRVTVL